jgi:hypothetical protein
MAGNLSGHAAPTQVPRDTLPKTSPRWGSGKGRNPHENRMRVATAADGRRSRDSSLIGNAAPAARLTGQNVRGLSQLKLEKVLQFMKERRLLVTCLMETWQVTPQGWYSEDIDGFLVIHHGETAQSCNRGRSGVAIILSPEARAAWELGGSWVRHSSNGRALTVRISVEGGGTLTVYSAYAPTSGNTSAARQAFYDDVLVQTRSENQSDVLALFIDGNASMGVGARPGTWERDKRRAVAQRAAEIAERRAVFDANNNN